MRFFADFADSWPVFSSASLYTKVAKFRLSGQKNPLSYFHLKYVIDIRIAQSKLAISVGLIWLMVKRRTPTSDADHWRWETLRQCSFDFRYVGPSPPRKATSWAAAQRRIYFRFSPGRARRRQKFGVDDFPSKGPNA